MNDEKMKKSLKRTLNTPEPSEHVLHYIKTYAEQNAPEIKSKSFLKTAFQYVLIAAVISIIIFRFNGDTILEETFDDFSYGTDDIAMLDNLNMFEDELNDKTDEFEEMLDISSSIESLLNEEN